MGFYDNDGDHTLVFIVLLVGAASISSLFSILNIYLIRVMKLYNGYILLILSMAWSQLIYDIVLPASTGMVRDYTIPYAICTILNVSAGYSVAIFSNVMAISVLYVIYYKVSVDIIKNFKWYCALTIAVLLVSNILYIIGTADASRSNLAALALLDMYYYFRLASIGLNFVSCGFSYLYTVRMNRMIGGIKTRQDVAICTLSSRMQYYPLVQGQLLLFYARLISTN